MADSFAPLWVDDQLVHHAGNPLAGGTPVVWKLKASKWPLVKIGAYNGSITSVTTSNWTFSYSFNGNLNYTRIAVHGSVFPSESSVPWRTATAVYTVDSMSFQASVPTYSTVVNDVALWTSPRLEPGSHSLTVEVINATSSAPYFLDYIIAYEDDTESIAAVRTVPSLSTSLDLPSSSSVTRDSPTSTTFSGDTKGKAFPTGSVVGAVVGGVVLLLGLSALLLVLNMRLRRAQRLQSQP
ncbi:hypothetical protein GY45DRAFT_695674 [Cubamyces sp. BRFM 1775]|nr:hypothetical protein GY45DRAFT_695674 [Cubamyces sp. BRFM 1775]